MNNQQLKQNLNSTLPYIEFLSDRPAYPIGSNMKKPMKEPLEHLDTLNLPEDTDLVLWAKKTLRGIG